MKNVWNSNFFQFGGFAYETYEDIVKNIDPTKFELKQKYFKAKIKQMILCSPHTFL